MQNILTPFHNHGSRKWVPPILVMRVSFWLFWYFSMLNLLNSTEGAPNTKSDLFTPFRTTGGSNKCWGRSFPNGVVGCCGCCCWISYYFLWGWRILCFFLLGQIWVLGKQIIDTSIPQLSDGAAGAFFGCFQCEQNPPVKTNISSV